MTAAPPHRTQKQRRAETLRNRAAWKEHIRERDGYCCVYSGKPASDVHHVVPLGQGGADVDDNGMTLTREIHGLVTDYKLFVQAVYKRNHYTGEYLHIGWLFSKSKNFGNCEFRGVQQ